jgi:hypothetical protein
MKARQIVLIEPDRRARGKSLIDEQKQRSEWSVFAWLRGNGKGKKENGKLGEWVRRRGRGEREGAVRLK